MLYSNLRKFQVVNVTLTVFCLQTVWLRFTLEQSIISAKRRKLHIETFGRSKSNETNEVPHPIAGKNLRVE